MNVIFKPKEGVLWKANIINSNSNSKVLVYEKNNRRGYYRQLYANGTRGNEMLLANNFTNELRKHVYSLNKN